MNTELADNPIAHSALHQMGSSKTRQNSTKRHFFFSSGKIRGKERECVYVGKKKTPRKGEREREGAIGEMGEKRKLCVSLESECGSDALWE